MHVKIYVFFVDVVGVCVLFCCRFSLTTLFNERFSQNILLKLMNKINIYEKCQLIMIVIELEKRKHFILEYEKCFIGQHLIKSLLYYKMCTNKNDCIKMIKTWLKNNCISHVSNKIGSFKETEFYTFNKYIVYKKAYQSRTESNKNNNNNNSQYHREYKDNNLNTRHSGNNLDKYRRKKRISFLSANKSINIGFVSDNEYYYDTVCTEDSTINGNKKYRFKKKRKSKVSPKKTKKKRAKTHENVLKFQRNDSENDINSVNDDAKELINLTDLDIKRCSYTDDMKEEVDTVSALHNNDSGQYKMVNSNTTTPLTLKDRRSSGIRITKVRRLSWFNLNN